MNDPRWYVGPWIWDAGGVMPCWRAPAGTVGTLDMRAIPHISTAGGTPQGQGVFLADGPIKDSNYTLLGAGGYRDVKTSQALRDRMPKRDRKREPTGDDLLSHLLDCLTDGSDPTGDSFAKPIMPDASMRVRLTIGGFDYQWKTAPWNYHWDKIQDVERADFQRCFDDAQSGRLNDKEHHRRVLDALCDKYGADDWKAFVPTKLRKSIPGRLKHETTITESFNKADSTALGPDLSWTALQGSLQVKSNRFSGNNAALNNYARADSDLSSADHYSQVVLAQEITTVSDMATFCRNGSGAPALTFYFGFYSSNGTDAFQTIKAVAGAFTGLSSTNATFTTNDILKIQASGSSISRYRSGSLQGTVTDTSVTGGLRCGVEAFGSDVFRGDSFEAGDLVASSGTNYMQLRRLNEATSGVWFKF